jgi:translation elongation factor EF-4
MGVRSMSEPNPLRKDLLAKTCGGNARQKHKLLRLQNRGKKRWLDVEMIFIPDAIVKVVWIRCRLAACRCSGTLYADNMLGG